MTRDLPAPTQFPFAKKKRQKDPYIKYTYFAQRISGGPIKIGTSGDLRNRMFSLTSYVGEKCKIHAWILGNESVESRIHAALVEFHLYGEWFIDCDAVRNLMYEMRDGILEVENLPDPVQFYKGVPRVYNTKRYEDIMPEMRKAYLAL